MSRPTRPRLPPSSDSTFESFVLHVTSSSPFRDENSYSQDKKSTYFDLTPTTPSFSLPTIVSRTTVDRSPSRKFVASLSLLTFAVLALLPFLAQGDWSRSALTALDRKFTLSLSLEPTPTPETAASHPDLDLLFQNLVEMTNPVDDPLPPPPTPFNIHTAKRRPMQKIRKTRRASPQAVEPQQAIAVQPLETNTPPPATKSWTKDTESSSDSAPSLAPPTAPKLATTLWKVVDQGKLMLMGKPTHHGVKEQAVAKDEEHGGWH